MSCHRLSVYVWLDMAVLRNGRVLWYEVGAYQEQCRTIGKNSRGRLLYEEPSFPLNYNEKITGSLLGDVIMTG